MNAITIISLKKGTLVSSSLVVPCSWQFIQRLSISENTLSALMSSKRPLASGSPSAGEVVEVLVDMLLQVIETQQRRSAGKRKERRKSQERAATRMNTHETQPCAEGQTRPPSSSQHGGEHVQCQGTQHDEEDGLSGGQGLRERFAGTC